MFKPPSKDDDIDFSAWIISIRQYRVAVASIVIVSVILGVFVALSLPEKFRVEAKLVYQSSAQSTGGFAALASLAGVSIGSGSTDASTYLVDILKSGRVLESVLEKEWFVGQVFADTSKPVLLEEIWDVSVDTSMLNWQQVRKEQLLRRLRDEEYIGLVTDKKSNVITLTTEFEDPKVAYDINKYLFQVLNDALVNRMNFKASTNRKFIGDRLKEVKIELANSEDEMLRYLNSNRVRSSPTEALKEARLQREVLINSQVFTELQKQYEMAKIEEARDLPLLDIIDAPRFPINRSQPNRKVIVILSLFIGAIVGASCAVLYGYSQSFKARH